MAKKTATKKGSKKKGTKKAKGKSVVKRGAAAVTKAFDYSDDADAGFEGMTREDFVIPFLGILQPLSPQVDTGSGSYVEGAEASQVINTVTQDLWDGKKGLQFIPCHRAHNFIEWVPRKQGGGLVKVYDAADPYVVAAREGQPRFGAIELANKNELIETFSVFGLVLSPAGTWEQAVISFSSTQIKPYKQWMTRASAILIKTPDNRNIRPPLFAHRYLLTTRRQENDAGIWWQWVVDFADGTAENSRVPVEDEVYLNARAFRNAAIEFANIAIARAAEQPLDGEEESM